MRSRALVVEQVRNPTEPRAQPVRRARLSRDWFEHDVAEVPSQPCRRNRRHFPAPPPLHRHLVRKAPIVGDDVGMGD